MRNRWMNADRPHGFRVFESRRCSAVPQAANVHRVSVWRALDVEWTSKTRTPARLALVVVYGRADRRGRHPRRMGSGSASCSHRNHGCWAPPRCAPWPGDCRCPGTHDPCGIAGCCARRRRCHRSRSVLDVVRQYIRRMGGNGCRARPQHCDADVAPICRSPSMPTRNTRGRLDRWSVPWRRW